MAVTMADITKLRKMTGAGTVSYTHLDVYKRQLLLNEPAIYRDLDNCWSVVAEAIQDVYKRQSR